MFDVKNNSNSKIYVYLIATFIAMLQNIMPYKDEILTAESFIVYLR